MTIALLTDFGTRDPYVAAMKGVLVSRTAVPVIDLTHEIAPFDVLEAAWFLATVVPYWSTKTIFVCVVDPGVGTSRRIIATEIEGRVFLAPDNGLLTFVSQWRADSQHTDVPRRVYSVEDSSLFLPSGSNTFHGRDRFAPVAAALANGLLIDEVGPRIDRIVMLDYDPPSYDDDVVRGTIVAIDRFGNVITDIDAARVPFAPFALRIGEHAIERLETSYGDASPGPFLIIGSSGHIEISIANARAPEELRVNRLQRVEVRPL
jgi:S-adenosylmethionine hydrolase